jgi:putative transposase
LSFLGVPIIPHTYFAHVVRSPSKRALWDMSITEILTGCYTPDEYGRRPPESLYGSLKMWCTCSDSVCRWLAAPCSG